LITNSKQITNNKLAIIEHELKNIREYDLYSAVHFLSKIVNTTTTEDERIKDPYFRTYGNVQFRSTVSHARPATAINHVEMHKTQNGTYQPVLWVNFIGIAGIQGPLQSIYTERVFRNTRNKDNAFAAFLDIFNHRLVELMYTAKKWIPGYSALQPCESHIGKIILALCGINDHEKTQRTELLNYFIAYETIFWRRKRSALGLEQMLQDFFQMPIEVACDQCMTVFLKDNQLTKLGVMSTLGRDICIGNRIWYNNRIFDVLLLDLPIDVYESFNSYTNSDNWLHLTRLCKNYLPFSVYVRYFIQIKSDNKKQLVLGESHYLGFNTWLGTKPLQEEQLYRLHDHNSERLYTITIG
jgi:type VI secretion system protein ImpH